MMNRNYTVEKVLSFCAAHRLYKYPGNCGKIHGHRYEVKLTFESPVLDELGMVLDFNTIVDTCQKWLKDEWDHSVIVCNEDDKFIELLKSLDGQTYYVMSGNPTAENMSEYLLNKFKALLSNLFPKIQLTGVTVWETPTSSATSRCKFDEIAYSVRYK